MASLVYKIGDADEFPSDNSTHDYSNLSGYSFQRNPTEDDRDMGRKIQEIEDLFRNQNTSQNFSNIINTPVIHGHFQNDASTDKDEQFQKLCHQLLSGHEQKFYCLKEPYTFGGTAYYRFMYVIAAERGKAIKRGGQDANKFEYQFSLKQVDPFLYDENLQTKGGHDEAWNITSESIVELTDASGPGTDDHLKLYNLGSAWVEPCWAIKNNIGTAIKKVEIGERSGLDENHIDDFGVTWEDSTGFTSSGDNVLYIKPKTRVQWSQYFYNVWKYGQYSSSPSEAGSDLYDAYDPYAAASATWRIAHIKQTNMPRVFGYIPLASPQSLYMRINEGEGGSVDADVWAIYRYRWF